jgi:DNA repair exonuclease SbcCD ATPase subunit
MIMKRSSLVLAAMIGAILLVGCADETSQLKQRMAELEKKFQKQEKDLKEFSTKFSLPRDFSADIQRIEDQQERVSQIVKTKVDPANAKLEEFREWAQEAQKERDEAKKKLKSVEDALAELDKKEAEGLGRINQVTKAFANDKKTLAGLVKGLGDLSKTVEQLRKEFQDNNTKIVEAVKKTLPKVRDAAVADLKTQLEPLEKEVAALKTAKETEKGVPKVGEAAAPIPDFKSQLAPLEKELATLKTAIENDRKTMAAMKAQASPEEARHVQALNRRIRELEEVLTSQKQYLLEVGSKVHELEMQFRKYIGG